MELFNHFIGQLNNLIWGLPMIILIVGVGIYLAYLSRMIQIRRFGRMWRETIVRTFRKEGVG